MTGDQFVFSIFLIFSGAALLATLALYARQSLLVAYILLGVILGPWGSGWVANPDIFKQTAHVGIMFLLFLLGLDLQPQELLRMLGKAIRVTAVSALLFALVGAGVALAFGFSPRECLLIGAAMMFSSTIIGVKLLPTTALHHQHAGEIIISVLLLQDILAIVVLMLLQGYGKGGDLVTDIGLLFLYLPALVLFAGLMERYVLSRLLARFDRIQEYIFLLAIGWCLGIAELASVLGLSTEIGAFVAGISLARSPIALFIVQNLKPLRDFFLVMFFFSLGATFDMAMLGEVIVPGLVLAALMLVIKPWAFGLLLTRAQEQPRLSREIGVRLGQISEFSLLIVVLALESSFIEARAAYLVQVATIITFVVSSYWVTSVYPTPIAVSDRLRRD